MNATHPSARSSISVGARLARGFAAGLFVLLSACGGSADAPPPPERGPVVPTAVPPTITLQPVSVSVTTGQPASFSVAASGTAPITYQWERNGTAIAGATSTTYTIAMTAMSDSGAVFSAVATNVAGSATSENATLTVTAAAPVLTITQQPANTTVVAGATATFTVAGTCSSGTLDVQWQRSNDAGATFAVVAGATASSYSFMTAASDTGAQFRAVLDCSGQSTSTSNGATLTVTAPTALTLSLFPIVGLRAQANISFAFAIDQQSDGSWVLAIGNGLSRLAPDLLSLTSFAGGGFGPAIDGVGPAAVFGRLSGVTHDGTGNLYLADGLGSNTVRKVTPDGTVTTIAGALGQTGYADGTGSAARFSSPGGIVMGPDGDLYVADTANQVIRRVSASGVVTTYAGVPSSTNGGYVDGPAATAQFSGPSTLAVTSNGDLYVADTNNDRIRKIARSGNVAGAVTTFAGGSNVVATGADGIGTAASIPAPTALSLRGNVLYAADGLNVIRQIDLTTAVVTRFTGQPSPSGSSIDGPATRATLAIGSNRGGIAPGPGGGLVIADYSSVRVVDATGGVTTIASVSGQGTGVLVQRPLAPQTIAVDTQGRIVVYEGGFVCSIRRVDTGGNVTQLAGLPASCGVLDGVGSGAQFGGGATTVATAPDGSVSVIDGTVVRRLATDDTVTTIAGVAGQAGATDGAGSSVRFSYLTGISVGPTGDTFVADPQNAAVRRVTVAGTVTTAVGALGQSATVDGSIASARLSRPSAVAFAPDGALWIVDGTTAVLRRVSPDGQTVSTPAGAPSGISSLAFGADGTAYLIVNASGGGLFAYNPTTATSTLLIPYTGILNLGTSPTLRTESSIAVLGPKQIVIADPGLALLLVTMP